MSGSRQVDASDPNLMGIEEVGEDGTQYFETMTDIVDRDARWD